MPLDVEMIERYIDKNKSHGFRQRCSLALYLGSLMT